MNDTKSPIQHKTAKELIVENIEALMNQLEQGHSEAFIAYLDAMSRFHRYSFGNILEIYLESVRPACEEGRKRHTNLCADDPSNEQNRGSH